MAKEFRIIRQGEDFIVQEKCLWWWSTLKHVVDGRGGAEVMLTSITRFKSMEDAREVIEDLRPKKSTPISVIETRIIW